MNELILAIGGAVAAAILHRFGIPNPLKPDGLPPAQPKPGDPPPSPSPTGIPLADQLEGLAMMLLKAKLVKTPLPPAVLAGIDAVRHLLDELAPLNKA